MPEELFPAASPPTRAGPRVHNGAYTVSHEKHGHFTVKLYTAQPPSDLAWKRILALLVGPDNTSDWKGVAFWREEADWQVADVWRTHRSDDRTVPIDGFHWGEKWTAIEKKLAIWSDLVVRGAASHWKGNGYTLLREGRCVRCNRLLTHPESIDRGVGPECWELWSRGS